MQYKNNTLGIFAVTISSIDYAAIDASLSVEQMQKDLNMIQHASAVRFTLLQDDSWKLKKSSYEHIQADVLLTPGHNVVVFEGIKTGDAGGLSLYARKQLADMLEEDLIQYAKHYLEDIRTEAKARYLGMAKAKFQDAMDNIQAGLSYILQHACKPKFGSIESRYNPRIELV